MKAAHTRARSYYHGPSQKDRPQGLLLGAAGHSQLWAGRHGGPEL